MQGALAFCSRGSSAQMLRGVELLRLSEGTQHRSRVAVVQLPSAAGGSSGASGGDSSGSSGSSTAPMPCKMLVGGEAVAALSVKDECTGASTPLEAARLGLAILQRCKQVFSSVAFSGHKASVAKGAAATAALAAVAAPGVAAATGAAACGAAGEEAEACEEDELAGLEAAAAADAADAAGAVAAASGDAAEAAPAAEEADEEVDEEAEEAEEAVATALPPGTVLLIRAFRDLKALRLLSPGQQLPAAALTQLAQLQQLVRQAVSSGAPGTLTGSKLIELGGATLGRLVPVEARGDNSTLRLPALLKALIPRGALSHLVRLMLWWTALATCCSALPIFMECFVQTRSSIAAYPPSPSDLHPLL